MIWRHDAPEGPHTKHETLIEAMVEPPGTPEAEIRGERGQLLAESDPFICRWEPTLVGKERIEQEARGVLAKCSTLPAPAEEVA